MPMMGIAILAFYKIDTVFHPIFRVPRNSKNRPQKGMSVRSTLIPFCEQTTFYYTVITVLLNSEPSAVE